MIDAFLLVLWAGSIFLALFVGSAGAWAAGFVKGRRWEQARAQSRWDGRERRGIRTPTDRTEGTD